MHEFIEKSFLNLSCSCDGTPFPFYNTTTQLRTLRVRLTTGFTGKGLRFFSGQQKTFSRAKLHRTYWLLIWNLSTTLWTSASFSNSTDWPHNPEHVDKGSDSREGTNYSVLIKTYPLLVQFIYFLFPVLNWFFQV